MDSDRCPTASTYLVAMNAFALLPVNKQNAEISSNLVEEVLPPQPIENISMLTTVDRTCLTLEIRCIASLEISCESIFVFLYAKIKSPHVTRSWFMKQIHNHFSRLVLLLFWLLLLLWWRVAAAVIRSHDDIIFINYYVHEPRHRKFSFLFVWLFSVCDTQRAFHDLKYIWLNDLYLECEISQRKCASMEMSLSLYAIRFVRWWLMN